MRPNFFSARLSSEQGRPFSCEPANTALINLTGLVTSRNVLFGVLALALFGPPLVSLPAKAQSPKVAQQEFANAVVPIPNSVAASVRAIDPAKMADTLEFEIVLQMRGFAHLQDLIAHGHPASQEDMRRNYLPLQADYLAVTQWLTDEGLTITGTDPSHLAVFARGTIAQIQTSLSVKMVDVTVDDVDYHTANSSPSLPASIASPVLGINGLQPFIKPRKHVNTTMLPNPGGYTNYSDNSFFAYDPNGILAQYGAATLTFTGSGQKIAILIDTFANDSDLQSFWTWENISQRNIYQNHGNIENINVSGTSLPPANGEETLDEEWASAIAPNATVRVYATGGLSIVALDKGLSMIQSDLTSGTSQQNLHQLSISMGGGEKTVWTASQVTTDQQYFAVIANAGVSVFVSSGDWGASPDGTLQAEYYASDPNVTAVGGTQLSYNYTYDIYNNITGLSTTGEVAWKESNGMMSGGGKSIYFMRPSWQTGSGVVSGTQRLVPDVALTAHGALVLLTGTDGLLYFNTYVGTSWATPVWAGFCAMINEARACAQPPLPPIGLLNPAIYPLIGTGNFNDITSGTNGAYNAGAGYDMVTGIGTPNMTTLIQTLTSPPVIQTATATGTTYNGCTLNATVNPNGSDTIIYFQYGTTTSYGSVTSHQDIGSGTTAVPVSALISGLIAATTYHFRVVTTNSSGTFYGPDQVFTTQNPPPSVTTGTATAVTYNSAIITGTVNPNGLDTSGSFNYGTTVSYGSSTNPVDVGSATSASPLSTAISGLLPNTVYHYQIIANNSSGSSPGADQTFTTANPPPSVATGVATTITYNSAIVTGTVNPNGLDTYAYFEYGKTMPGTSSTTPADVGSGTNATLFSTSLSGLDGDTYYFYQIQAYNSSGNSAAAYQMFQTGPLALFYQPRGAAVDSGSNVYVADTYNHTIRKITPTGIVSTFAGTPGVSGTANGTGGAARFNCPEGVAVDASGNIYVADTNNNTIRKITSAGLVTTLAGTPGVSGTKDGSGSTALFNGPLSVAESASGYIYVADSGNNTIRKITSAGAVTTLAGTPGVTGTTDGTGGAALFNGPLSVAVDASSNVYAADWGNNTIRKISSGAVVTTLAGTPGAWGSTDGTGAAARFSGPRGVAVDASGNVYVADTGNSTIRKIASGAVVTTLAGTAGAWGSADGTGSAARFSYVYNIAVDASGNIYAADSGNNIIRKVTSGAVVTTLAGSNVAAGVTNTSRFYFPDGVGVGPSGNLYIMDTYNEILRKMTPTGSVTTLAGALGVSGTNNGTGTAAQFYSPYGNVAVDSSSNVYVADTYNNTVRKVTPLGVVTTLAGTPGVSGTNNGTGGAARFNTPWSATVSTSGNVYVADSGNNTIRKITSAGVVTTLAGTPGVSGTKDGAGSVALFNTPRGVAIDASGNIYVADSGNNTIRKITSAGVVTTLAGSPGVSGANDGTGSAARFNSPRAVAVDSSTNVYVSDGNNCTIRKISSGAVVTTLAGTAGISGSTDGTGTSALFSWPNSLTVDANGNIYVADGSNCTIRKITSGAVVTTIGGRPGLTIEGSSN